MSSIIGIPTPRIEGNEKVRGETRYAADLVKPGMLWGKNLRSPYPHARIVSIDASPAKEMPGVAAVITGKDIPLALVGRQLKDTPVLASDRVRFVGQKVAAVAAETLEAAEQALELIRVEYEELPAVYDPLEAMSVDAPVLHEGFNTYEGRIPPGDPVLPGLHLPGRSEPITENNVYFHASWGHGDVEEGFLQAAHIIEHTFTVSRVHQSYFEPHACLVWIESDSQVQVRCSNKSPFMVRRQLSQAVSIPEEQITVEPMPIGGDFGGKGNSMDVPVAYHLARLSGRPVKMVMTHTEELTAANPRHPAVVTIRTGIAADGRLTARRARVVLNGGAYGGFTPRTTLPLLKDVGGVYRIPDFRLDAYSVYTNCVPSGHFRGPGQVQVVFAVESHTDMIARELGIDPVDFRLRNVVKEGDLSPSGEKWLHIRAEETLRTATEAIGWSRPRVKADVGLGLSLYEQHGIGGPTSCTLTLQADGQIVLTTLIADTGSGAHLLFRQIIGEELGIPLGRVRIQMANTNELPFEQGVSGSRVTHSVGSLVFEAAVQLRGRILTYAAERLGCDESNVFIRDGTVSGQGRSMDLGDLAAGAPSEVTSVTMRKTQQEASITGFVAQAVEVEVDRDTGQLNILNTITVHDVGRVLNPIVHRGQIEGALVQSLGYALMEDLQVTDGRVATPSFADYKIPTIRDIPPLTVMRLESGPGQGPYQARAIAEAAISGMAPAIANAIDDAVGVRIRDIPVTAEKVYRQLMVE